MRFFFGGLLFGSLLVIGVLAFVDFFVGPWLEEEFGLPVGSVLESVMMIVLIGSAMLIISGLIVGISSCGEKIDSLESKMDDLGREIDNPYDGLKGKMDNLEEKMDDLKNEIVGYYGEGGLKNEIGDLEEKMDNLEEKMDDLKNEIVGYYGEGGLKNEIGDLEEKMDEIQRDLRRNEKSGRTKEESEEED